MIHAFDKGYGPAERTPRRLAALVNALLVTALLASAVASLPPAALASGRSGGGTVVDSIRVNKAYYADTGAYVELLINAVSSDSSARLYAYLPDGTLLGEVQNGDGGRYGGTVFVTMYIPQTITILSTSGGSITVLTAPFQF